MPRAPDCDTLVEWWEKKWVTGHEFMGHLLPLLREENVDELAARIPQKLQLLFHKWAQEMCEDYSSTKKLYYWGAPDSPVDPAYYEGLRVLCGWLAARRHETSTDG